MFLWLSFIQGSGKPIVKLVPSSNSGSVMKPLSIMTTQFPGGNQSSVIKTIPLISGGTGAKLVAITGKTLSASTISMAPKTQVSFLIVEDTFLNG